MNGDDRSNLALVLEKNQACRQEMCELVASGGAIAFIGSGLSIPLGYPSWDKLLADFKVEAKKLGPISPPEGYSLEDPLELAESIKRHFHVHARSEDYYTFLGQQFCFRYEKGSTEAQQLLAGLPFKGYVTTNYEISMEHALQASGNSHPEIGITMKLDAEDAHKLGEFLRSLDDVGQARRIVHLHGRQDGTRHIVLTLSDYEKAYSYSRHGPQKALVDWNCHRRLVWALLATRRLIFVGTSLSEPPILELFKVFVRDTGSSGQRIHYFLVPVDEETSAGAEAQERKFLAQGVQLVYYEKGHNHSGLDRLLVEVKRYRETREVEKPSRPLVEADRSSSLARRLLSRIPAFLKRLAKEVRGENVPRSPASRREWLASVNRRTERDREPG